MSRVSDDLFQTSWPDRPAGTPPARPRRFGILRELPVLIALAFVVALAIKTLLIQAFYIPSESMVPTLVKQDRVLVNKLAYRFRDPRRGEIVVFVTGRDSSEGKSLARRVVQFFTEGLGVAVPADTDFIKRVIALPGETIQIKDAVVTITPASGKPFSLSEPYISPIRDAAPFGPFKVPPGHFFLMGDNRTNSSDSRVNDFGGVCPTAPCAVPKSRLVGKAFLRIWPPRRIRVFAPPAYGLFLVGAVARSRRRRSL